MRRLALLLAVAFVALGCKQINPDYCPDAGERFNKSCAKYAASFDAKPDGHEVGEVGAAVEARDAVEAGDAITDAVEAPAEKKPFCTVDGGECAAMADGGTALACDIGGAAPKCVECVDSSQCKQSGKTVCDTKAHRCVECVGGGTGECPDTMKPVCDTVAQKCVMCVDNTKCTGMTPICDATKQECRGCAADLECKDVGPGICVDFDGHCASTSQVVTLQGGACTPSGMTFCKSSDAVNALTLDHAILVVQGPSPTGTIDPPATAPASMLVLGRTMATVAAGAGDAAGVHVTGAHKLWVRDLTVSGGTTGIVAEQGAELHVTRCTVTNNGKGGIMTVNAAYEITNTIVAGNMLGLAPGGVGFGGVRLGDVMPTGAIARFENNTIVDNKSFGVSCSDMTRSLSTSIVHGNLGGELVGCAASGADCCGAGADPKLDASYRLMSTSPCIDKLTATSATPAVDFQLQLRPTAMGKLDCGADEFVP